MLAGGLALGGEDLKSPEGVAAPDPVFEESGVEGVVGVAGSFILLLENILSSSYINHGIYGATANTNFVVQVWAG